MTKDVNASGSLDRNTTSTDIALPAAREPSIWLPAGKGATKLSVRSGGEVAISLGDS